MTGTRRRARRRTSLAALAVALLLAGCSSSGGDKTSGTTTLPLKPLGPKVEVGALEAPERCDPLDTRHCLLPFPSDTFTEAASSTATAKRISFARESMPANEDGVRVDPTEWNRNDGFSPGQAISVYIPGVDPQQSGIATVTDIGASLRDDAPVVLLDAVTGERHPYWAELDATVTSDGDRVLYIRPARNYPEAHRMIVALRDLRDRSGNPIPTQSAVFAAYRDRNDTGIEAVEARRDRYERVFADLAQAGVTRDDLFLAWDFTVASGRNLSERMLTIRDDAFGELADGVPEFTVDSVEENPSDELARRVTGTMQVPLYLTGSGEPGSRFVGADTGALPTRNGRATFPAQFICIVPRAALTKPARLSLYGHGLLGSPREVGAGNVRKMAQEHDFVFCATAWIGMSEGDVPNAISTLQNLSNFPALADRSQQGFLNALFLGRLMKQPQGLASHEAFRGLLDTSELFYDGNSQGGIMGGALTAVSTEFERAVLGVPGMNYSTLLQRSSDWDTYRAVYDPAYPNEIERGIGISLIQMLWDRGEANGYAQHMTDEAYVATPPHQVLMHVAFGDHQVAQDAAEVEARTIGAKIHCPATAPGRLPATAHWDLECADDGYARSVLVYWDSGATAPPTVNLAPSQGADPHEDPRADAAARRQKAAFLRPEGTFTDVCNGAPCTASPT